MITCPRGGHRLGQMAGRTHHEASSCLGPGLRYRVARSRTERSGQGTTRKAWSILPKHWIRGHREAVEDGCGDGIDSAQWCGHHRILSRSSTPTKMRRGMTMPIRRYAKIPRTTTERQADDRVQRLFEQGSFLKVDEAVEREAIEHVQAPTPGAT